MTSLVIPALDDGAALRENLPRLAALGGEKELIVADGGGNEEAIELCARLGARVVRCGGGRGPQLNAGAAAARGERLLFLHADCWLDPGALAEADAALADPAVGGGVFRQRIEGNRLAYRCIELAASLRAAWLRRPYGDSGLFLRRADFVRIGGYPELPLCEDLGMAPRLRPLGRVVVARARVHLSARRWERKGVTRATLVNWWIAGAFRRGVAPAKLYALYYGRAPGGLEPQRPGSGELGMKVERAADAPARGRGP